MSFKNNDFRTPGQLIQSLLDSKGWSKRTLSIVLGMDETGVNRLVSDKRSVTAEIALLLEEIFGERAERFLELQKSFDLEKARIVTRPDPKRGLRAHLFGGLPVAEMIKRGWLPDVEDMRDTKGVEAALSKFFGVSSPDEIEILPHAAKKTEVSIQATPVQIAWLYRVKEIASELLVAPYYANVVRGAIGKLENLLLSEHEIRKVPRILAECGIRYVIVETLPTAKIDGVCLWLNDKSPVIGMSLRYDRIDNFWFILRHELEHVIRQHGQTTIMLDAELEGERTGTGVDLAEEERAANQAAAEFCIPQKQIESFIARKAPYFTERDILGFAATLKVHPGIVAGRLQHETKRYDRFRDLLVKVRSEIAPSAIVDGWGDVAPVGL